MIGTLAYFALRIIGKIIGSWLSSSGTSLRSDLFRGSMAQGPLAIAMALSMRIMFEGEFIEISYDVALIVIALNELLSARMLRPRTLAKSERTSTFRGELMAGGSGHQVDYVRKGIIVLLLLGFVVFSHQYVIYGGDHDPEVFSALYSGLLHHWRTGGAHQASTHHGLSARRPLFGALTR